MTLRNAKDVLKRMGRLVLVTHVLQRKREERYRYWEPVPLDEPRAGWVVGCRSLKNGTYVPGWGSYEDYVPAELTNTSSVFAVLVAFWPTEKPHPIPLLGVSLDLRGAEPYAASGYGTGKMRRTALECASRLCREEKWPRDAKGRWVKEKS